MKGKQPRHYIVYRKAYKGWYVYLHREVPEDHDVSVAGDRALTRWGGWLWAKNYMRKERKAARVEARRRYV